LFKRVVRRGGAVLGVVEEVPVYELFGVSVEEGLECIRGYLWDRLFKYFETPEGYGRLWEGELKPLAERALRDTYKVFHYFNPERASFISNDAGLLGWPWGELKITLIDLNLESHDGDAIEAVGVSDLQGRECDFVGSYFVVYADEVLESIAGRYGEDAKEAFYDLFEEVAKGYPAVVAASAVAEEGLEKLGWLSETIIQKSWKQSSPAVFCLACDEDTFSGLNQTYINPSYLRRALESLGYKLEILDAREGWDGEWKQVTLGVLRAEEGTCIVFAEEKIGKELYLDAESTPCHTLNKLVESTGGGMEDPDLLRLGKFTLTHYLAINLEDLPKRDRGRIGLEYLRMRREGRWHGKVDLGRWEVYVLASPPGEQLEPALLIHDRQTHKVYMTPPEFTGSLREAEKWMERRRDLLESWYKTVAEREDSPPELLELMTSIFLFEDLKS